MYSPQNQLTSGIGRDVWIGEYGSRDIGLDALNNSDIRYLRTLASENKLTVIEKPGLVTIDTSSWVGVVRLSTKDIHIQPKDPIVTACLPTLLALAYSPINLRWLAGRPRFSAERQLSVTDLLALLLSNATDEVARKGLLSDYTGQEEWVGQIRGRIVFNEFIRHRQSRPAQVPCRFEEFELNNPANQVLALTLRTAAAWAQDTDVRRAVLRSAGLFSEVSDPSAESIETFRWKRSYHRQNQHYKDAHDLAFAILDGLEISAFEQSKLPRGDLPGQSFLVDMNKVFERFVWRLVERLFSSSNYQVDYQTGEKRELPGVDRLDNVGEHLRVRGRPDIMLTVGGLHPRSLPIDAKYKLYGGGGGHPADIYQALFYAISFGDAEPSLRRAVLIHPAAPGTAVRIAHIQYLKSDHANVTLIGLDVRGACSELLSTPGTTLSSLKEVLEKALLAGPTPAPVN